MNIKCYFLKKGEVFKRKKENFELVSNQKQRKRIKESFLQMKGIIFD